MFPVDIAKFLRIVFLYNTSGGCFWQSYHGTVKSAGVPVLWFRASTCFQFRSKTFTECCLNNSLLSRDKTISSLLDLIGHVLFLIWEYILKKHCFQFWWKTYTKRCRSNYVISRVKRFSSPAICGWSDAFYFRYDLETGPLRWKSRFWFCSVFGHFADLKTIYFASCLWCSWKLFQLFRSLYMVLTRLDGLRSF